MVTPTRPPQTLRLPRLVVAAPASGVGKTAVVTALLAAWTARGLAVSGHKVGPDYIDPGYHALACGRPPRNLDPVMVGAQRIPGLFGHGAAGAEVAVVEGVLGLFDGRLELGSGTPPGDDGSTAHVARLLEAPVVLVVDASAASRSVAAVVHGFATFDPRVRLTGVILNRVGSPRHEMALRDALAPLGLPVLGALPRDVDVAVPSRHLGLIPAAELAGPAVAAVRRLAELAERHLDLAAVLTLARSAPPLTITPWHPADEVSTGPPVGVAVAGGAAFTFGYTETVELLTAAGAQVSPLDPLTDQQLPARCRGVVIGGGFPELHTTELSANQQLRAALGRLAGSGGAVLAECAGLLYLGAELDGMPMCGVVPARARMSGHLTLGYRDASGAGLAHGVTVTGHEFHRTVTEPLAGAATPGWGPAWEFSGTAPGGGPTGFSRGRVHASYLHVHPAGAPGLMNRFVAAARAADAERAA